MMATFVPAHLHGVASVPPAKSEAHRALLLAALGSGACRLHGFPPPLCDDTLAMIDGVTALGATVSREEETLLVTPGAGRPGPDCDARACAAALRMLIPAFWARGQAVCLHMEEALYARPLSAFEPLARRLGATLRRVPGEKGARPRVELAGRMPAGAYEIDGSLSSQFASGMLIALSYAVDETGAPAPSVLQITPPIVSRPYLDMTLEMMARFGRPVRETEEGRFELAPSGRLNPGDVDIAPDWSQAAVLLCANALGAGVHLAGMREGECGQGDARVVGLLREMGMSVRPSQSGLYMTCPSRAGLMPLRVCCEDIPDIAPILALTCTQARGTSVLTGVKRLRVKECDRLNATVELLRRLGAEASASEDGDTLTVRGGARLRGGFTADARGDHRMVMLLAVAATRCDAPITVTGAEAVAKSWPGFFDTYRALGGVVE